MTDHQPAADLVRRREAGVGMERRDVDAVRFAQQEQRQERDERLVEVEDVEAFAVEQLADLAEVAGRERQGAHRAVHREAEADPDAQDVALGRALRTVARGDDPDVVAAQPEVLVEVPDVLGDPARLGVDVRADETDLHRSAPGPGARALVRGVEPRWALPSAGIAVVAARPVAPDPAGDLVARVAAALAQLLPERAQLAGGLVERAAVRGRPRLDGDPQLRRVAAREARPAGADRLERMGVAVAEVGEAVVVGEAHDPAVPRLAERRRVERLEAVGVRRGVRVVEQPPEHPALGAQREWHQRMGRDRQPACLVDGQDRGAQRAERPDGPVHVQRQQVAAERRHLLADDDLRAQAAIARDRPGGQRRVDPLVVGDGDDVEVGPSLDVVEDGVDARGAVAGQGVDVEIGAPETRRVGGLAGHAAAPRRSDPAPSSAAAAPPRLRGRARSGRRPPTTGRGRRR